MHTAFLLAIAPSAAALSASDAASEAWAGISNLALRVAWPTVRLWTRDARLIAAERPERMLLGRICRGNTACDAPMLQACDSVWDTPSAGIGPSESHWGDYLALSRDRNDAILIARAPCGRLPCYLYRAGNGFWYAASRADLILRACNEAPRLDAVGLAQALAWPQARGTATCLAGLRELPAGGIVRVQDGLADWRQAWSPWTHADPAAAIMDGALAAPMLRTRIQDTTKALASGHEQLVLALSGGLDSSIVAASLAAAQAPVTAINLATRDPLGDERSFARQVCEHLGLALHIASDSARAVDLWHSDARHLPRPTARAFTQSADRQQAALAQEIGATAFVSGGGGDQVFAFMHSCAPLLDYLATGGSRAGALALARDICTMTGTSIPALVWASLRRAARRDNRHILAPDLRGLSRSVLGEVRMPAHPWGEPPRHIPPGKVMHVAWLQQIENHLEGYGRERERPILWPLIAQPVVELALRIPSWMWCAGGRNRAVARQAFAPDLPAAILQRTEKGSPESVMLDAYEVQTDAIIAAISDGVLAELGLIDQADIAALAAAQGAAATAARPRLMGLLDAEIWARHWRNWPAMGNHGMDTQTAAAATTMR